MSQQAVEFNLSEKEEDRQLAMLQIQTTYNIISVSTDGRKVIAVPKNNVTESMPYPQQYLYD
jgi:hypothetical protein